MTETVDPDKRGGERESVDGGGGGYLIPSISHFSISISHPSVFHWERRGASDGSGRGEGTEKS